MTRVPHVLLGHGAALTLLLLFLMFLLTEGRAELQIFCQPALGSSSLLAILREVSCVVLETVGHSGDGKPCINTDRQVVS